MNNASLAIFQIYNFLIPLRDTLEYCLDREHGRLLYDHRKTILATALKPTNELGKLLYRQYPQYEGIREQFEMLLDEIYGENSTILFPTKDGKIRVDHTQHGKIYDIVFPLCEAVRGIVNDYYQQAVRNSDCESIITDLLAWDDRMYHFVGDTVLVNDFQKSFNEFQIVVRESHGKVTPQSTYIVNNEILKYINYMRFLQQTLFVTDNNTLDVLDHIEEVISICEGRRDRRNNMSFNEVFSTLNKDINQHLGTVEKIWQVAYQKAATEAILLSRKQTHELDDDDSQACIKKVMA